MNNQAAQTMPLPASRGYLHLHNTGGVSQVYGYTADQMQAYAQQARADLEAENKRLREDNEILRRASIFFAGELDPRNR